MLLTRRKLVQLCAAGAAALPARSSAARRESPNILFLLTDQQRFDCAGAYGNRVIRTPNIDRIAREGALFRCAYSSTPTCTPARSAILTGLSAWHHGMRNIIEATYLEAQALFGLGQSEEGRRRLQRVPELDQNHAGAADVL